MKHDKLFLVRILCLIGIAGELLIPNNIIRMLFGLFFAIISVAFLLMHKKDIILEEKYSLQGTTQGNGLTGGVPPVRFSM